MYINGIISMDRDVIYFLVICFSLSYIVEFFIILKSIKGDVVGTYVLLLFLMYIPTLSTSIVAVLFRGDNLSKYGIDVGNLKYAPIAYLYPLAFILIGAVIMDFMGFQIDWGFEYLKSRLRGIAIEMGTTPEELANDLIMNSFVAPFFNMIFAVGEEVGWRGYLLDKLRHRNSLEKSLIATGFIWAIWHAPLIVFIGYNYPNLRALGILLFIPFCISQGIILAWLKYRSRGIVLPALGHGAINAFSLIGLYLYPYSDLLSLVVGLPGVIVSSMFAVLAYLNLKKIVMSIEPCGLKVNGDILPPQ